MTEKMVTSYLDRLGFEISGDGKDIVTVRCDRFCDMACVEINGKILMEGNHWDFHNGCHGIVELPPFHSREELARVVANALEVNVKVDDEWRYAR